jgi:hypothetical protein
MALLLENPVNYKLASFAVANPKSGHFFPIG